MIEVLTTRGIEMQCRRVALGAVLPEFALVLVLVAVNAVELIGAIDPSRMALQTVILERRFGVEAGQRKPRVRIVIEWLRAFAAFNVARRTRFVRKLTLVGLAMLMATGAGTFAVAQRHLWLVAAPTRDLGVLAKQRQSVMGMIDSRALEGSTRRVTALTAGG